MGNKITHHLTLTQLLSFWYVSFWSFFVRQLMWDGSPLNTPLWYRLLLVTYIIYSSLCFLYQLNGKSLKSCWLPGSQSLPWPWWKGTGWNRRWRAGCNSLMYSNVHFSKENAYFGNTNMHIFGLIHSLIFLTISN